MACEDEGGAGSDQERHRGQQPGQTEQEQPGDFSETQEGVAEDGKLHLKTHLGKGSNTKILLNNFLSLELSLES